MKKLAHCEVAEEMHKCECGHGRDRHSDKIAGVGHNMGYLCLIATCPCWSYRLNADERNALRAAHRATA